MANTRADGVVQRETTQKAREPGGEIRHGNKAARREGDQPHDPVLDHALEETFPASDPVSISPGSD